MTRILDMKKINKIMFISITNISLFITKSISVFHSSYIHNCTLSKVYNRLITGKKNKQKFPKQKALMKFVRALL